MNFRPATRADLARFHGQAVPYSARAMAGEIDGETVGVGGVYYRAGTAIAFSAFDRERLRPRDIIVGARRIMALIDSLGAPVMACSEGAPGAITTLLHFGFAPIGDGAWRRG